MILDLCGVMTHFFEGNCVLKPFLLSFWHDLDLYGVMTHFFEGNCVLTPFLLSFWHDLDLSGVMTHFSEGNCVLKTIFLWCYFVPGLSQICPGPVPDLSRTCPRPLFYPSLFPVLSRGFQPDFILFPSRSILISSCPKRFCKSPKLFLK